MNRWICFLILGGLISAAFGQGRVDRERRTERATERSTERSGRETNGRETNARESNGRETNGREGNARESTGREAGGRENKSRETNARDGERGREANGAPEGRRDVERSTEAKGAKDAPAQDRWGGHMETEHVGKTEAQMRERMEKDKIPAVSTFKDFETADRARKEALDAKSREIDNWLKTSEPGERLSVEHQSKESLGTRVTADGKVDHSPSTIFMRLERTNSRPEGYRIVTGFPK